ncbi:MAG: ABC transporter permease [Anaerolineae bacterium]
MKYIARRILTALVTLWLVTLITFLLLRVMPGNPAMVIVGTEGSAEAVAAIEAQLGLNRSLLAQYVDWLGDVVRGDLGASFRYERPVSRLIWERMPVTLSLTVLAMVIALSIAVPLGVLAALRHNSLADYLVLVFAQLGLAVPFFWLGILAILLFALKLGWLPTGGYAGWDTGPLAVLRHLLLPSATLAMVLLAVLTRMTRSSVLDVLHQDYIRTARAKGLSTQTVLLHHTLKNALLPVVTVAGLQIANLLAGSVVVEQVFSLPGLGRLVLFAVGHRDWPLIQGLVLFIAGLVVIINLLVDLLYRYLDPRISLA